MLELPLPDHRRRLHEQAQRDAASEREQLLPRIPRLTLVVDAAGEGVVVRIDRREAADLVEPLSLDPGEHVVVVSRGEQRVERRVTLIEGDRQRLVVSLPPIDAPPPPVAPPVAPPAIGEPPDPAPPTGPAPPPVDAAGTNDLTPWWIVGLSLTGATGLVAGATWYGADRRHADFLAYDEQISSGAIKAGEPGATAVARERAAAAAETRRLSAVAIGFGIGAGGARGDDRDPRGHRSQP